jgi:hypothetical protein
VYTSRVACFPQCTNGHAGSTAAPALPRGALLANVSAVAILSLQHEVLQLSDWFARAPAAWHLLLLVPYGSGLLDAINNKLHMQFVQCIKLARRGAHPAMLNVCEDYKAILAPLCMCRHRALLRTGVSLSVLMRVSVHLHCCFWQWLCSLRIRCACRWRTCGDRAGEMWR